MAHETFSARDRRLGMCAAWAAFALNEAYAVASGAGFLSLKSPSDAIGDPYLSFMAALIILMAPFLVVVMVAVARYAAAELKAYGHVALAFMTLLVGVTSSVNFALLTVSHTAVPSELLWPSLFLPYRWPALAYALDIFAWDWFFSLSMLFAAPVFGKGGWESAVRATMIASGVLGLAALVWLVASPQQAVLIGIVGWGVAGPIVFLLLALLFGRAEVQGS